MSGRVTCPKCLGHDGPLRAQGLTRRLGGGVAWYPETGPILCSLCDADGLVPISDEDAREVVEGYRPLVPDLLKDEADPNTGPAELRVIRRLLLVYRACGGKT